jgi:hypothetical protein
MLDGLFRKLQWIAAVAVSSAPAIAGDGVDILRFQKDPGRNREWVLTPNGVAVVDMRTRETKGVSLPEWVWAGEAYLCPPDLALGPNGEAVVSSNVLPALWRIDPVSLRVTRHDLVLDADTDRDVGFSALTWSPKLGVYFAVADAGTLWRIDPLLRRAQKITLNELMPRACGVTRLQRRSASRLFGLCVRTSQRSWAVHFTPDQRAAYARPGCDSY